MQFRVEFLNYGRFGVVAFEPRTRVRISGDTLEKAQDNMRQALREYMETDYVPPQDGPYRTIETIEI